MTYYNLSMFKIINIRYNYKVNFVKNEIPEKGMKNYY